MVKNGAKFGEAQQARSKWQVSIKAMGKKGAQCQIHMDKVFNL